MPKINLTLPDGKSRSYDKGITGLKVAKSIGPRLAMDAVAIEINGIVADLNEKIDGNAKIKIITFNEKLGLDVLRHSLAHLLAAAVMELHPGTKRTIGPQIENGFYYDFKFKKPITVEDLPKIQKKMQQILPKWDKFTRQEVTAAEAKKEFKDKRVEKLKAAILHAHNLGNENADTFKRVQKEEMSTLEKREIELEAFENMDTEGE